MKRPRSVASRSVNVDDYKRALTAWRCEKNLSIASVLGPSLVEDLRGVQPHHIVQMTSLFDRLISAGLTNAVVLPSKLETALVEVLASDDFSGLAMGRDLYAHKVGRHIAVCFSMLRILKMESHSSKPHGKSNAFRRRCTTSDNAVIAQLTARLVIDQPSDVAPQQPASALPPDVGVRQAPPLDVGALPAPSAVPHGMMPSWADVKPPPLELEDTSLPTCFSLFLSRKATPASTRSCSMASTVLYDDGGSPLPNKLLNPLDPMKPITPVSKQRKKDILKKREELGLASTPAKMVKQCEVQLFKPKLSFSKAGRAELCCRDASGRRVFVFGSTEKQYGLSLKRDAEALCAWIQDRPGIRKGEALQFRDSLRAQK